MILPDGRRLVHQDLLPLWKNTIESSKLIPIHQNFRMIVLANKPGWPFLGIYIHKIFFISIFINNIILFLFFIIYYFILLFIYFLFYYFIIY